MVKFRDLAGKKVVITGGASGIGLATSRRFIKEGSKVFILDWNKSVLEDLLSSDIHLTGGIHCDVSDPEQVSSAFKRIDEVMGGVDILIANAGISIRKPFLDIEYEEWSQVLKVNLDGAFLCAQEAVKRMRKQKSGVVLFTASNNAMRVHPLYTHYNASKAGVILLAKTLALEYAPWLRANAVCPGYVLTPMQETEYTPEMMKEVNQKIPLKRHAQPEEVADLFAFLASSSASYITGQAISIDGGETI